MDDIRKDYKALKDGFTKIEDEHSVYMKKMAELSTFQDQFLKQAKHERYLLSNISTACKNIESTVDGSDKADLARIRMLSADLRARLDILQADFPAQNNGFYLSLILGSNLNLSLLTAQERYKYKQEYENFKWKVSVLQLLLSGLAYFAPWRFVDSLLNFLLVWYYCTLTIREAILTMNGSKIKGWWVFHHYLSCVLCGVTLTWRDGPCYGQFRPHYILFVMYIGVVQLLQYAYQSGCLRRLHALGQGHEMDVTMEGFTGWMFKGLTFLLPFLCVGYMLELFNAYTLASQWGQCSDEWQVGALSLLFLVIAIGNIMTTFLVIVRKYSRSQVDVARKLRARTKTE